MYTDITTITIVCHIGKPRWVSLRPPSNLGTIGSLPNQPGAPRCRCRLPTRVTMSFDVVCVLRVR